MFKNTYTYEPYLSVLPLKERVTLCKFRTSNHNLAIETGRHTQPKTPIENRTCKNCPQCSPQKF